MKKVMRKIITLTLIFSIIFLNFGKVSAYEQDILISNSIEMPTNVYSNGDNYIVLTNDLKNNSAVVKYQYISLEKDQFETLNKKYDTNNTYAIEQSKVLDKKYASLKEEQAKVEELRVIAEKVDATEEQKTAYSNALTTYISNVNEYNTYENNVNLNITTNQSEIKKLIVSYNNNNWKQISLTETTTTGNKYKFNDSLNYEYYILWVKVELNGQEYYQYQAYCNKKTEKKNYCEIKDGKYYNSKGKEVTETEYKNDCEEEIINICKIVDGKYYDNNGKEVTKSEYEKACVTPKNPKTGLNNNLVYGILISLVAMSSYVVVRKFRRFSK